MSERPDSPQRSNVAAASACTGRGNNSGSPKCNVRLSTRRRAADARQEHDCWRDHSSHYRKGVRNNVYGGDPQSAVR
jgi:hypothetical protein